MSHELSRIQDHRLAFTALFLALLCAGFAFPAGATPQRHTIDIDQVFVGCGGPGIFFCAFLRMDARAYGGDAYRPRFQSAQVPSDIDFTKPTGDRYRQRNESVPADFERSKPDRYWIRKWAVPID